MMNKNQIKNNRIIKFRFAIVMLTLVSFLREFDYGIRGMNTSVYALSYEYGFISRGLMGTLLNLICKIGGDDLYKHNTIFIITLIGLLIFYLLFFIISEKLLKASDYSDEIMIFILLMTPMIVRMFLTSSSNLGRTDMFLIILSILACFLIIKEKFVFLVIPITAMGMMIHQGYFFMYFNIVVAMLLYSIYENREKKKKVFKYYSCVLLVSALTVTALLFWFEIFRHQFVPLGEDVLNDVIEKSKRLELYENEYNEVFLRHEILGDSTLDKEWKNILTEWLEFAIFIVMSLPLIYVFRKLVGKILEYTTEKKISYILLGGSFSILPLMILKCDYGRWVFAIFMYYILLISFLIIRGNIAVKRALIEVIYEMKSSWFGIFCAMYFITFLPLKDAVISKITSRIALGLIEVFKYILIGK